MPGLAMLSLYAGVLVWLRHAALPVQTNAPYVLYTDHHGQLLDTLPVCQDFSRSRACPRSTCQLVHLESEHVETCDGRVTVCRDAAKGACFRPQCKFYHIPVVLPPANELARTPEPETVSSESVS